MANCSADYYDYDGTDSSKFGNPLPWIGLYIAAASLACLVAMTVDMFRSFQWSKRWTTSRFFAFNSTTLTLLAVATKIPSDITGAMPGLLDQLVKLSGLIFLCVTMSHAMPSLGAKDDLAVSTNIIALGIMVVSMFVDIWIQLNSGLIFKYYFRYIYGCYSIYMLLLLLFFVSHSLTVPTSRKILYRQYYSIHEEILSHISYFVDDTARFSNSKLEECVSMYWLMAYTSSPDYTLRTSELSHICAYLNGYMFSIAIIYEALFVLSHEINNGNNLRCFVKSDYSWSTWVVFSVQVSAIVVGCLTSYLRGSNYSSLTVYPNLFKVEKYRYQLLMDWKDRPLPAWISNKQIQQPLLHLRGFFLGALVILQFLVITLSRIVLILLSFIEMIINILLFLPNKVWQKCRSRKRDDTINKSMYIDMSRYVLYLTDEKDVEQSKKTARFLQKYPTMWIDRGRANQPINLDSLVRKNSLPEAFQAVREFYKERLWLEGSNRGPLNCWAMPIVTWASILYATSSRREHLMLVVGESLRYIRLVDENLDERGTRRMQKAANIAWENLYVQNRRIIVDFNQTNSNSFSDLIIHLHEEAKKDLMQDGQYNNPEYWPLRVFIANSMYTTTRTVLERLRIGLWSVQMLEKVIVGLLGACLTNLPLAIFKHCSSGTFGLREEKVREAAIILGETWEIITLLESPDLMEYIPEHKKYVESWSGRSPFPQPSAI